MIKITKADIELARKMQIALEPELSVSQVRLLAKSIELESAIETIGGLQKACDSMRAQRDTWHRRCIWAAVGLALVVASVAIREIGR